MAQFLAEITEDAAVDHYDQALPLPESPDLLLLVGDFDVVLPLGGLRREHRLEFGPQVQVGISPGQHPMILQVGDAVDPEPVRLLADGVVGKGDEVVGGIGLLVLLPDTEGDVDPFLLDGGLQFPVGDLDEKQAVVVQRLPRDVDLQPGVGLVHDVGRHIEGDGDEEFGLFRGRGGRGESRQEQQQRAEQRTQNLESSIH